jgi:hypothetical protein
MNNVALIAGVALLLGSCGGSDSTYDRQEFIADIIEVNGVDRETATCIALGYEEKIGVDRITATEQTETEIELAANVQAVCVLGE